MVLQPPLVVPGRGKSEIARAQSKLASTPPIAGARTVSEPQRPRPATRRASRAVGGIAAPSRLCCSNSALSSAPASTIVAESQSQVMKTTTVASELTSASELDGDVPAAQPDLAAVVTAGISDGDRR